MNCIHKMFSSLSVAFISELKNVLLFCERFEDLNMLEFAFPIFSDAYIPLRMINESAKLDRHKASQLNANHPTCIVTLPF